MRYVLSEDIAWLRLDACSGSVDAETDWMEAIFDGSVPPGLYQGRILVSAEGAVNSPRHVDVAMTVDGLTGPVMEIVSAHGMPDPDVGSWTGEYGAVLTHAVATPETVGWTQYVCVGWAMTGNEPVNGASNVVVMTHTNDATLIWLWTTNYWLAARAGANGEVGPCGDQWLAAGSNVTLTATADEHYRFEGWTGDTNGCAADGAVLTVPMTGARSIVARFAADPRIAVQPAVLHFGTIRTGASVEADFTVENVGGGILQGEATVSGCFSIVQGSAYSVETGTIHCVRVQYAPVVDGLHSNELVVGGGGDAIVVVYGRALGDGDSDGDSVSDWGEYVAGTCWTNENDYFRIERMESDASGGDAFISWLSVTGRWYTVCLNTNLSAGWTNVWRVLGDGGYRSFTNDPILSPAFFRLSVEVDD